MNKIKKLLLFTLAFAFVATVISRISSFSVKAYDSIDSTGKTTWTVSEETIQNKYGVYYSHAIGKPSTNGGNGTEKNVNYFEMKTDGVNSKLVTWARQANNGEFSVTTLTKLAEDYEKNHPGWIVVSGINADQWYYGTNQSNQKGGYYFFKNQSYYPFTMDGQNLFTINPLGGSGNGIGITNNSSNPFVNCNGTVGIELQIYNENDELVATYPVAGYNQTAGANQVTVWSGYTDSRDGSSFVNREVSTSNSLFVVENAELAYMNNTRDYASIIVAPYGAAVDSFYGRGLISSTSNSATLTKGQFAIETTNQEVISKLATGVKVVVEQQYSGTEANKVESVTGFHTIQVMNGEYQPSNASYNTQSRPRSFFGIKEDGSYFLLTTRDVNLNSKSGTMHTENNAILSYYGAYTAYQDDGGGSVTAIYRNDSGSFDVVSSSCDNSNPTSQRSVFSGLFFVVRDPSLKIKEKSISSISFAKKENAYTNEVTDIKVNFDGKSYSMESGLIKIDGLEENKEYEFDVEYMYKGQKYESKIYGKTTKYAPKLTYQPLAKGMVVNFPRTDTEVYTSKVKLIIDGEEYIIDNSDGSKTSGSIEGLYKGETYNFDVEYEVTIVSNGFKYTRTLENQTITTLTYEAPVITSFTAEVKRDKIQAKMSYDDPDGLIQTAYIVVNGEEYEIDVFSVSYNYEGYNNQNEYKVKYVLEYLTPEDETVRIESEEIVIEKESSENNQTPDPTPTPTPTPTPEPAKKGCKKKSIVLTTVFLTSLTIGMIYIKKKHN